MRQMVSELGCTFMLRIFFFRFSPFYHKRAMKRANFMRRHYTIEQEKNMDRKRRNKMTALSDPKFDFFPFFSGLTFQAAKF